MHYYKVGSCTLVIVLLNSRMTGFTLRFFFFSFFQDNSFKKNSSPVKNASPSLIKNRLVLSLYNVLSDLLLLYNKGRKVAFFCFSIMSCASHPITLVWHCYYYFVLNFV